MNSNQIPTLPQLSAVLNTAISDNLITASSSNKVVNAARMNPFILQGMQGPDPSKVRSSRVIPCLLLIDNSASMRPHQQKLIDHGNRFLAKIERSTDSKSIVLAVDKIESSPASITNGFRQLKDPKLPPNDPVNQQAVQNFTSKDISTSSGTALYDSLFSSLSGAVAYITQFNKAGSLGRLVVAVLSDGLDEHSSVHTAVDVKDLMEQLNQSERVTMIFFGFGRHNFKKIALEMGFKDENIIEEAQLTDQLLGEKFDFISNTLISVSQGLPYTPPPASQTNSGFVSP